MKALHQLLLALVLTIPIYLGLANSPLDDRFQSGAGWRAFEPLFDAMARLGIHGGRRHPDRRHADRQPCDCGDAGSARQLSAP
ncbi:hypothetical protein [Burkholderia gladioli]|uniref:hypothetical protein n=1 Tax=Burkholderia gladioli TaxID=28095 RepID=UPI001D129123|nr:hypothetical protein [Burkholderia gladioli]